MSMSRSSKMLQFINYIIRVMIQDRRQLVGKFMAFDCHMNLVLGDCEFRKLPPKKGANKKGRKGGEVNPRPHSPSRRRGGVHDCQGPSLPDESRAKPAAGAQAGSGIGRVTGQGIPIASLVQAQPGLFRPVRGVGGPSPGHMQPQISRPPMPQVSSPPMTYPPVQMRPLGPPPSFSSHPRGPSPMMRPPPGAPMQFGRPRPGGPLPMMSPPQFGQWPMGPPPQMMRGPPPPMGSGPPRPGMPPPPRAAPPRPGMPPPPGAPPMYGGLMSPRQGMPPPPGQ